jgi:hypothetical protein
MGSFFCKDCKNKDLEISRLEEENKIKLSSVCYVDFLENRYCKLMEVNKEIILKNVELLQKISEYEKIMRIFS